VWYVPLQAVSNIPGLFLAEEATGGFNYDYDETAEKNVWGEAVDALRSMSVFLDIGRSTVVKEQDIAKQEVHATDLANQDPFHQLTHRLPRTTVRYQSRLSKCTTTRPVSQVKDDQ
jgi:hypothetical protein